MAPVSNYTTYSDVDELATAAQPKLSHKAHPDVAHLKLQGKAWVDWSDPTLREVAHEFLKGQKWPSVSIQAPDEPVRGPLHVQRQHDFPPQDFESINPALPRFLEGYRWQRQFEAFGLGHLVEQSWKTVLEEKEKNFEHVLRFPYNGETTKEHLMGYSLTPVPRWFVRNHGEIPHIPLEDYRIKISGLVNDPQSFTLDELKALAEKKPMEKIVTLQCSGGRRIEQIRYALGDGDALINAPWHEQAIGNARWSGISLKRVIKACGGFKDGATDVEFIGADTYFKQHDVDNYKVRTRPTLGYVCNDPACTKVSVPIKMVKAHEVMIAWGQNGEPLTHIHGAPARIIAMGVIGARSCKWVIEIRVLPHVSEGPVQRKEYLLFNHQLSKYNSSFLEGFSIQDMPVSSAFMAPREGEVITHHGHINFAGWAYSGGGHFIQRVEVSPDGGHCWYPAHFKTEKTYFGWRLWDVAVPVSAEGWIECVVRAWDSACNTQPSLVRSGWNWGLHVTCHASRIKIFSINRSNPITEKQLNFLERSGVPIEPLTEPLEVTRVTDKILAAALDSDPREPKE